MNEKRPWWKYATGAIAAGMVGIGAEQAMSKNNEMEPELSPKIEQVVKPSQQKTVDRNGPTFDEIENEKNFENTRDAITEIYSDGRQDLNSKMLEYNKTITNEEWFKKVKLWENQHDNTINNLVGRLGGNYSLAKGRENLFCSRDYQSGDCDDRVFFKVYLKNESDDGTASEMDVFYEDDGSISIENINGKTENSELNFNNDSISWDKLAEQIKTTLALKKKQHELRREEEIAKI